MFHQRVMTVRTIQKKKGPPIRVISLRKIRTLVSKAMPITEFPVSENKQYVTRSHANHMIDNQYIPKCCLSKARIIRNQEIILIVDHATGKPHDAITSAEKLLTARLDSTDLKEGKFHTRCRSSTAQEVDATELRDPLSYQEAMTGPEADS
jgi:hypothetical protein